MEPRPPVSQTGSFQRFWRAGLHPGRSESRLFNGIHFLGPTRMRAHSGEVRAPRGSETPSALRRCAKTQMNQAPRTVVALVLCLAGIATAGRGEPPEHPCSARCRHAGRYGGRPAHCSPGCSNRALGRVRCSAHRHGNRAECFPLSKGSCRDSQPSVDLFVWYGVASAPVRLVHLPDAAAGMTPASSSPD